MKKKEPMLTENDDAMRYAEKIYDQNMSKYGFSFTPKGLYDAAFDSKGKLYKNWKVRIEFKKPEPSEYPELYDSKWVMSKEKVC